MPHVKIRDNESIDEALRRFKRECEKDGLMAELKKRDHFETPTVRRKRKQAEAIKKKRRKESRGRVRIKDVSKKKRR